MPTFDITAWSKFSLGKLTLEQLLGALLTLLLCLAAARLLLTAAARLLKQPRFDPRFQRFALAGVKALLYTVTVLVVADSLGVPVASLVTLLGVFGLAVSLAVQDVLGNVAGGLVILLSKPFLIGDYIESDVGSGTVVAIDTIHTKLDTPDGQRVLLPNSKLSASRITNYTRLGVRRLDLPLYLPGEIPVKTVRRILLTAAAAAPGVRSDPTPAVVLQEFGDRAIQYRLRCWFAAEDFWDSRAVLTEAIKTGLETEGISLFYHRVEVIQKPSRH